MSGAAGRVVVIGAGHNGLVAAVRLAQAGREVVVLEAREQPGGLCEALEFHPGYRAPAVLQDTSSLRFAVVRELQLERFGLELSEGTDPVFVPDGGDRGLLLHREPTMAREEIAAHSPADAEAYARWRGFLGRIRGFVAGLASEEPPPLGVGDRRDLRQIARRALGMRRLGRKEMIELLRVAPMCAADWLGESFETPHLVEALAAPGVIGTFTGPWSAGSAANLILHECTVHRQVRGGVRQLVGSLVRAAEEHGARIRTGSRVRRILVEDGKVTGVTLTSGEQIRTPLVAASCDPTQTLLELLEAGALGVTAERQIAAYRSRGTTASMLMALDAPLEASARPGETFAAFRIGGGDIDQLERAFDAVKYGQCSSRPHLEIRVPTLADPDLAPAGHHVAAIFVSFVPRHVEGGWTSERKEVLRERVIDTLRPHFVDLDERIVATSLLTPEDLESEWNLTGGHVHHGEHALDQLLSMRPIPLAGRYRTPIQGLFLAGSGSHPGGGITGAPGMLAAEAILRHA